MSGENIPRGEMFYTRQSNGRVWVAQRESCWERFHHILKHAQNDQIKLVISCNISMILIFLEQTSDSFKFKPKMVWSVHIIQKKHDLLCALLFAFSRSYFLFCT